MRLMNEVSVFGTSWPGCCRTVEDVPTPLLSRGGVAARSRKCREATL